MNMKIKRFQRNVDQIRAKFEEVKKLDGTSQDTGPKGDGYVEINDEYESRGHIEFGKSGEPVSMKYSEWQSDDLGFGEESQEISSFHISKHEESGQMYYFQETESKDGEYWNPGPRVAVDPQSGEVTGSFGISQQPHKFVPLEVLLK